MGEIMNMYRLVIGKLKEKTPLRDIHENGKVILKWTIRK